MQRAKKCNTSKKNAKETFQILVRDVSIYWTLGELQLFIKNKEIWFTSPSFDIFNEIQSSNILISPKREAFS